MASMTRRRTWLSACLALAASPAFADATYHSLEGGDFEQDWSNAALITANDDWSGVPSIIGLRGDGLASTGADPQTVLTLDAVVDVNANQANPNTFTTGGVTEFAIADPVVALAGSTTADAPSLLIHVDTTNRYNVTVEYNLRDIDGSTDNSTQAIALQYRVGNSGNFTNLPGGFVADASTGPSAATLVTPISVTLPAAADNQAQVQIRILTADATGADEWIGIDDLLIYGEPPPPPAVTIADASVTEGNPPGSSTLTFTATLAQAIGDDCVFRVEQFGTPPGTAATPGVDFNYPSPDPEVTILAGQTTATFDVPIVRDTDIEGDEQFVVSAYGEPFECDISGAGAVGTIVDDDMLAPPDISIANLTLFEGSGGGTTVATLTVSLSAPAPAGGVTVDYATANGSATIANGDYTAASGTLNFAPGDTTQTLSVNVAADDYHEPNETFLVTLSGAAGGNIATGQATVTLNNDDALSAISVSSASVVEGTGAGSSFLQFSVSISAEAAPETPVTVDFATAAGSATDGSDYTGQMGSFTFANGQPLLQLVQVPVTRDNIDEADETLQMVLSNPSANAALYVGQGTGTIEDDDTATVAITSVTQNEGNAGSTSFTFTVSLSVPAATSREFAVYTQDVSATAGSDYTALTPPGTPVIFAPLATTQTVSVSVNGDTTVEPDETFEVRVAPATTLIEGLPPPVLATGIGTIVNDDVAVNISINDASVTEGTGAGSTNAVFTVTLSAQPPVGAPVTVSHATASGSATSGTDFTATSGTLTFNNGGALTQTISVPVTRDNIDENDEGFVVDLTATGGTLTDAQGAGSILDDDAVPTPSIGNLSVSEGNSGTTTATFTVSLSNPSSFPLAYQVSTADGTAQAPGDYTAVPALALDFAPLQTTQTVNVSVIGELLVEANETFVLNLVSAVPDGLPTVIASGTATINNDDSATLSIAGSSGPEGNTGTTPRSFTATLSAPVQGQVQVSYATADGSATLADADYQAASGTLTFADSVTTQSLNVSVVGDTEVEPDQSFAVNLSSLNAPAGVGLGTASANGLIVNDDAASFSISGASVVEGTGGSTTLNFSVSLSATVKDPVTVQYATAAGSAGAPADFASASGTLTFSGSQSTQLVPVSIVSDNLVEPDESFTMVLSSPSGATIATASATGTIVNDDAATLSINDLTLPEGNGGGTTPFAFTISSSNPSAAPITVNYQTSNGSAGTPNDYGAAAGTATIPAGATSATVTVLVVADDILEPNETFSLTLSGAQGATISDATAVGTILGDDQPAPVSTLDPRTLGLLALLVLTLGMAGIARRR